MTALMGTFVKIGTMADGTPRIVLDLQCTLAEIAAMGLIPGVPFALARLEKEVAAEPFLRGGENAKQAALWCRELTFWAFLKKEYGQSVHDEASATKALYALCEIRSRVELDHDSKAEQLYRSAIVTPYQRFMRAA